MKKLMIACCVAVAGGLWAKPELAATAEIASFGDISKKVTMLGSIINNPIVPTLVLGAGQQQLAQTYGRFRSDSPMYWQFYADNDVVVKVLEAGEAGGADNDKPIEKVLIYPSADGVAKMTLNHPGSKKEDDGTLHLPAGEDNSEERWVKFSKDGKYCSIASSADFARRAIEDFEAGADARKGRGNTERPIARLDVYASGMEFVETLQRVLTGRQDKREKKEVKSKFLKKFVALQEKKKKSKSDAWSKFGGATILFDLDEKGISTDGTVVMKSGKKVPMVAGKSLPAGALDVMTSESKFFNAGLSLFQGVYEWENESEFKADMAGYAAILRNELVEDIRESKDVKQYSAVLEELVKAVADVMQALDFPAVDDWSAFSLAFNAEKHPYVLSAGKVRNAGNVYSLGVQLMDRIGAALEKQWPGKKIVEKKKDTHVIDWAAAVDAGIADSGLSNDQNVVKAAQNAKKTIAQILGSTKTEMYSKMTGDNYEGHFASPGFKKPALNGVGEACIARALPEAAAERPGIVFYFPLYGFARDVMLPILAKQSSKEEAQQYETLISSMPPAESNSAIAAAGWIRKNGSMRVLLRITSNELKNFGAAFNAFTAASMATSLDSDED